MSDLLHQTFNRFLDLPHFDAQLHASLATEAKPRFDFRRIYRNAMCDPVESDLWALAHLSHSNDRIRRANPQMTVETRAGLYSLWYAANPDCFLLLERTPADSHGTRIVGNTVILPLRRSIFSLIEEGNLPVVGLRAKHICAPGERFDVLLFDTWVMHDDYQDSDGGIFTRRSRHLGYGNVLPLRHLSLMWNPFGTSPLHLYVEPDSRSMLQMTERMGFVCKGRTAISEPLLELTFPPDTTETPENALVRRYTREVIAKVRECTTWTLAYPQR